jgi:hypothetical protein
MCLFLSLPRTPRRQQEVFLFSKLRHHQHQSLCVFWSCVFINSFWNLIKSTTVCDREAESSFIATRISVYMSDFHRRIRHQNLALIRAGKISSIVAASMRNYERVDGGMTGTSHSHTHAVKFSDESLRRVQITR